MNAKDNYGDTGYHCACKWGYVRLKPSLWVKLVELLIKNSVECNINLNAKNNNGKTGYHHACSHSQTGSHAQACGQVQKLILDNSTQFNIDLNRY